MDKARWRHAVWRAGGIVLFALAPLGLSAGQSEWPSLRGPNHDGSASPGSRFGRTAGSLAVRWRAKLGSGYSGVAIASGRAVTMFSGRPPGRRRCLRRGHWSAGVAHRDRPYAQRPRTVRSTAPSRHPPSPTDVCSRSAHAVNWSPWSWPRGRLLWRADLVAREGARQPDYGFASSPIVVGRRPGSGDRRRQGTRGSRVRPRHRCAALDCGR